MEDGCAAVADGAGGCSGSVWWWRRLCWPAGKKNGGAAASLQQLLGEDEFSIFLIFDPNTLFLSILTPIKFGVKL